MPRKKQSPWKEKNVIIDYGRPTYRGPDKNKVVSFTDYTVVEQRKGSLEYMVSDFVGRVEAQVIKSPDDPLYRASSSIARSVVKDRTVGSVLALGIYCFLNEFSGRRGDEGDNDSRPKLLVGKHEEGD